MDLLIPILWYWDAGEKCGDLGGKVVCEDECHGNLDTNSHTPSDSTKDTQIKNTET